MKEYKIIDLCVGMKESFECIITSEMMKKFLEITGDINPLHIDADFARKKGFTDRVVYGMLTVSLLSTLGGCYLPGKFCLIQGVESKFVHPVFIGDTLTVTGEVIKVEVSLKYIEVKVVVRNQRGEKVLRGILKAGVMDEG